MADQGNEQITFNVKSSSDQKHVLTVPLSMTVGDLKTKLSSSEYADMSPERQRLIYSGRVLKDPDTLATCKIKDGNTVHLVKGAESNQRQNPANQGGTPAPTGASSNTGNIPQNIQAGSGVGNPLSQLTGARYAGFHGLPGADMFGADGGMGAPPNSDQMLRLLDDPNFAQQMNEAMNNPAVIDMLRNNPMIRNNPMARAAIENPELRRMMMNPEMIRMQMQMQRAMGGQGEGGAGAFPMPGATDTTTSEGQTDATAQPPAAGGDAPQNPNPFGGAGGANPFAALFPGGGAGNTSGQAGGEGNQQQQQNPFGNLFGGGQGGAGGGQNNAFANAAQQMMQNPEMMQNMMRMMGGGDAGAGGGAGGLGAGGAGAGGGFGGFNPFGNFGGGGGFGGSPEPQAPADTRPPEERFADQLRQLNDMGFYEFERNVQALRRSGGSVQGAVEFLLGGA